MAFFNAKFAMAVLTVGGIALGAGGTLATIHLLPQLTHANTAAAATTPAPAKAQPILFSDLPGVVVSIPPQPNAPSTSYVDIDMQFATYDAKALANFTTLQPIIKAEIISLLMNQTSAGLQDAGVRSKIISSCLQIANNVLKQNGMTNSAANGTSPFTAAYITNLVIQD
jgi:flagellar basal body-associated protein FliL